MHMIYIFTLFIHFSIQNLSTLEKWKLSNWWLPFVLSVLRKWKTKRLNLDLVNLNQVVTSSTMTLYWSLVPTLLVQNKLSHLTLHFVALLMHVGC